MGIWIENIQVYVQLKIFNRFTCYLTYKVIHLFSMFYVYVAYAVFVTIALKYQEFNKTKQQFCKQNNFHAIRTNFAWCTYMFQGGDVYFMMSSWWLTIANWLQHSSVLMRREGREEMIKVKLMIWEEQNNRDCNVHTICMNVLNNAKQHIFKSLFSNEWGIN